MKLTALLENIRSVYNVGSVFRSADSAGFDKIYLAGYTATPLNLKVTKTALRAETAIAWEHHCDSRQLVELLQSNGVYVACFETVPEAVSLFDFEIPKTDELCCLFGNEIDGVDPGVLTLADAIIHIPHYGTKSSLNIASAAAVGMYEMKRKLEIRD